MNDIKVPSGDWRRQGQEKYLVEAVLVHRPYSQRPNNPDWDHDHCEFCWAKFALFSGPDILKEGYSTEHDDHWICPACFEDFRVEFKWTVKEEMKKA